MLAPQPSSRSIEVPLNQALAYVIGTPTLLLAPLAYWQFDSSLFGPSGLTKLFIITAIGGTLSFALYGGRRRWFIGSLLGLIGGLGASGAHVLYTMLFHTESMWTGESALVCWAGAGPSMALLTFILKRDKNEQQHDSNQSTAAESPVTN